MALQLTCTTPAGIEVQNAYHRVDAVQIVNKDRISFRVDSFVSPNNPAFCSQGFSAPYDLDGANPYVQAYEYLKDDAFEGAEDV